MHLVYHISNESTDLAQSLEEYNTYLCQQRFLGAKKVGINGEILDIETAIDMVEEYARKAREIEHFFKYV